MISEAVDTRPYAPAIQRATVSLAWHFPHDVLPLVLRHLDPAVHFPEPFCADLLEALNFVLSELNTTDWPTVVDCLRQQHKLHENEQLATINEIFSLPQHHARA